ncbi:MAG: efflux RND transporter periplasmic adaptor subunit, partial [Pirellulaceae bacterium]|nr:efflux RND transporter periplasmic adaptor subunit [Pirellulaceae bacterium]
IAAEQMKAVGRLQSAQSELELQQNKLDKLTLLREKGHARQEEVERTRADVAIARSHVLQVQEELAVRKLEHEKASLQLARRTIRAPLDGVITKTIKSEGEFVAPNDPVLITIAKLDPLLANFAVPSGQLTAIRVGGEVEVVIEASGKRVRGVVQSISPITDAASGTVPIKVRLDNPKGFFRSGERCLLTIPSLPKTAGK